MSGGQRSSLGVTMRRRSKPRPCPCRCGTLGFCDEHRERLAAISTDLFAGKGRYGQRSDQRKVKHGSVCCNPACMAPRVPPAAFCDDCQAEGFTEEIA